MTIAEEPTCFGLGHMLVNLVKARSLLEGPRLRPLVAAADAAVLTWILSRLSRPSAQEAASPALSMARAVGTVMVVVVVGMNWPREW